MKNFNVSIRCVPLRCARHPRQDDGAILVLALVFILLIAFSVLGLLTFGGGGIKDAASLQGQRALEYAADGATNAAIESVRYTNNTYATPSDCLSGAGTMTIQEDSVPYTMTVDCSGSLVNAPTPQQYTRVIAFYTCQQSVCTQSNAVVDATVEFQDLSSTGVNGCYGALAPATANASTCGNGMVISSWTVKNADT